MQEKKIEEEEEWNKILKTVRKGTSERRLNILVFGTHQKEKKREKRNYEERKIK